MLEYRNILDYSGYRAGDDGSIWSCWKLIGNQYSERKAILSDEWRQLKPDRHNKANRAMYTIKYDDGLYITTTGARLILLAFVGACPDGMEACHKNGDATNDALYNLRWGTHQSNMDDWIEHRLQNVETLNNSSGNKHYATVVPDEDLEDIVKRYNDGETQAAIAKDYGIHARSVWYVINKRYKGKQNA